MKPEGSGGHPEDHAARHATGGADAVAPVDIGAAASAHTHDGLAGTDHNHDTAYVNETDHAKAQHDALGIDADTVDGSHASAFATSAHTHDTSHAHALGDLSNVTATGEGSGGGLDADTVDGQHASAFAASSHGTHVAYGTVVDDIAFGQVAAVGTSTEVSRADHSHSASGFAASAHSHALGDLSNVTATGEGSGGGFDADTVDGQHASAFATSGHAHASDQLIWIPSGGFQPQFGSPSDTTAPAGRWGAWSMPDGSTSFISAGLVFPTDWSVVDAYLHHGQSSVSGGQVEFLWRYTASTSGLSADTATGGSNIVVNQNYYYRHLVLDNLSISGGNRRWAFRLGRTGGGGNDTLAANWGIIGLEFVRVS